ncbi:MAG: exosome catalytic subunit dis3 [Phylliscum demangeonii]|nr:MAG: exosome catalytic subunit dis3 [Phylliscum demangeonii]
MTSLKRAHTADGQAANISSKIFVRSTRSGKVQKIVREIYLRQDIPCSSQLCSVCAPHAPTNAEGHAIPFVLSAKPAGTSAFPHGHYLVPDTNALLNGLDLFEQTTAFYDVIILQTVLEELRNRSLPLYNRLIGLTRSAEKRFYVFFNEFRLETYVVRTVAESINDRNDRAVRRAVQWYAEHLAHTRTGTAAGARREKPSAAAAVVPAVVMLSNDRENVRKARGSGLKACSLEEYVSGLADGDRLLDMINAGDPARDLKGSLSQVLYPEYLSASKLSTGRRAGTLHQGIFNVSPYNYLEGSVPVPAFAKPLLILGRENINRAVQGDVVVVEVLAQEHWKRPSSQIIEQDAVNGDDNPEPDAAESVISERERRVLQEAAKRAQADGGSGPAQPTARVVGVTKRNWRPYVGHVDPASVGSAAAAASRMPQTVFLIPMDTRIPKIRLRTRQAGALVGKRIVATIDGWGRESRYPTGHFVRALGALESRAAETEALLLEHDVQYRPFPRAVLDCLPAEGHAWTVAAAGAGGRADLRALAICSIDPVGCVDIDDALHARPLANGHWEVGVHIADVSHFVRAHSAMDGEARSRATTVYLVDKRIDMLPTLLGTDLCSLKAGVDRFAFSALWEMDDDAAVVGCRFTKSVIRSRHAFSYEQAQQRIDDDGQQDAVTQAMRVLLRLSRRLRARRMAAGALDLASPEVRIQLASETEEPVALATKTALATHSLVEEFMLLANIAVAGRIVRAYPRTALLRRHPAPPAANFEALAAQLRVRRCLTLDARSSAALAASLDACRDPAEPVFNTIVRILATRCMTSAEYFAAASHAPAEYRHYGLATEIYTHFTSPIRRYADLVVHRQLARALLEEKEEDDTAGGGGKGGDGDGDDGGDGGAGESQASIESACINLNVRHRNAQLAGRASVEHHVGQVIRARRRQRHPHPPPDPRDDDGDPTDHGADADAEAQGEVHDAFLIKIFANGVVGYVPALGIEAVVKFAPKEVRRWEEEEFVLVVLVDGEEEAVVKVEKSGEKSREKSGEKKGQGEGRERRLELFAKVTVCVWDEKELRTGKRRVRMKVVW